VFFTDDEFLASIPDGIDFEAIEANRRADVGNSHRDDWLDP